MKMKSIIASVAAAFSLSAFADKEVIGGQTFWYDTDDGIHAYLYHGYQTPAIDSDTTGSVEVPATLGGMPVTGIEEYAFYDCEYVTSVMLPNSVTAIGDDAFKNCGMASVTIPSSVRSIGWNAFSGSYLTSVEIPTSVTTFGSGMFSSCGNLSSVSLPAGMTKIPASMFSGCASLKTLDIPSSVTTIGDSAFANCGFESLDDVKLPSGVKAIGAYLFTQCPNLKTAKVPAGITSIGKYAFWDCDSLESVTIPDGVTSIGERAFGYCDNLKRVNIPASVTTIGDDPFFLLSSVDVIVDNASGEAARVKALLESAGCDMSGITVKERPTTCKVTFDSNGGTCSTASKTVNYGDAVGALPKATKSGKAFMGWYTKKSALGTRIWPSTVVEADVTYYARWTDTGCTSWTDAKGIVWSYRIIDGNAEIYRDDLWAIPTATEGAIEVPSFIEDWPVTGIGDGAFTECKKLTKITVPSGVTYVGKGAFFNCKKAAAINLPSSVTSVGDYAFAGCDALCDANGFLIRNNALCNYAKSGDVTVPAGVKTIGAYAFYGKSVNNVTLPEGVTSIGESAFDDCQYLATISVPKTLTSIGANAFRGNFAFTTVYVANASEASRVKKLFEDAGVDTSSLKFIVKGSENCTITFNANGGTCSTASKTVANGATVGELPRATRTGYSLVGWFTAASGGTQVTTATKVTANVTFYAQWKENAAPAQTYILRLHRNISERDGATAGRTYTIGKARALPKVQNELKWAPRKGYDFVGWAKTADATTAAYTDGQSLKDLTKTAGATVHIYAVWKAHKYIVRLHRNNSKNDGATTGRAFDYDQVRFLPTMAELKWVRSGYMFLGWSQAQSSTTVKYADGLNVFNLSANDGEELHVWGVWKKAEANAYLLRLHRNNSERDGATAGRQLKLNTSRKLPTVKELGWARTDATFKGWATTAKNAAAGKVAYKDGATVSNLVKTQGDTAHIYAVWQ